MNKNQAIEAINKLPENNLWNHDYCYRLFYDSGAMAWVRAYQEFEDSQEEYRVLKWPYPTIKGVFSPIGKIFTKDQVERLVKS